MSTQNQSEYETRKEKLAELREQGIDPYPARTKRTHTVAGVTDDFGALEKKKSVVVIAGRVRSIRTHGGSSFLHIEDGTGRIQTYFKKDEVGEESYAFFSEFVGIGDFLEVHGVPFVTKKGEETLLVSEFTFLSKALRPLPEKWHGLADIETRYRKRYLDLISNEEVRELFRKRTAFIRHARDFFAAREYMEVEIPVLEHVPGGADAEPFVTRHNTLDIDLYLRISLELYLKRLVVGGFDKVFEIGRVFRNEGMSTQHLQEFTMLECYEAYSDYNDYMELVEALYSQIVEKTFGTMKIAHKDGTLDFTPPWPRVDYEEIFKEKTGIALSDFPDKESFVKAAKKLDVKDVDLSLGRGRIIDQVYKQLVRPELIGPLFLIHHPVDVSPLAKRRVESPETTERFQVLIVGAEVGNGFSELNDPVDQKERFEKQMRLRDEGDKEAHMLDEDYIEALEHGMPPTAGFGVGIDRLFSIVANQDSVRDVVLFPTMRPQG